MPIVNMNLGFSFLLTLFPVFLFQTMVQFQTLNNVSGKDSPTFLPSFVCFFPPYLCLPLL